MKDYEFLEPAQIELEEEVKYYNEQQAGLGYGLRRRSLRHHRSDIEIPRSLDKAFQKNSPVQNKEVSIRSRLPDQGRQDPGSRRGPSQKKTVVLAR